MKRRRVKITGIGPVTPAGIGREAFWKGILEPVSRVRPYKKLADEYGPFVAAYIDGFSIEKYIDRSLVPKGAARQTQFAIAGSVLALADAGISFEELRKIRSAVITGSCLMDFGGIGDAIDSVRQKGPRGASARVLFNMGLSEVANGVNQALGITARLMAMSTQCSSGMDAIAYASDLVASGEVELALCGGAEAPLWRFPLVELRAAELTPPTAELADGIARPFDLWRTTGVVAEGACMFVIEPEHSPRDGYSYIAGYSAANDEDGICSGMLGAGRLAIAAAGARPGEVDSINAWGPGHKLVDAGEGRAMTKLFGNELENTPAFSIKGALGSALGAAPAMQVAVTALGQQSATIPPTVNWKYPDPGCPLNLSGSARFIPHHLTLINSHGWGGINASMVLQRC